jgi:hypothetical protein
MTESKYPQTRHATIHAWRRVSKAIGPGEARDLAADIAEIIATEGSVEVYGDLAASIEFALYPIEDADGRVGPMFGGNFLWTSDSRFRRLFDGPIPIHDRFEQYVP